MCLLNSFIVACFLAASVMFGTAHAYVIGEIPPDSTEFITLENQPRGYDIFNPPRVEVSMFADFSDSAVGNYLFTIWDLEDLKSAQLRLGKEFPEITELNKYVFFGIEQADKPIIYKPATASGMVDQNATATSISWGWKYARLVTPGKTESCLSVDYYTKSGTSKSQVLGVIKQFTNLVSNGNDAGKVLRSVADLYGKVEEVTNELSVLKSIVDDTE